MYNIVYQMSAKEKRYKKTRLQYNSNRYTLTIPKWIVEKVLDAKKGDLIGFDFLKGKVVIIKLKDKQLPKWTN